MVQADKDANKIVVLWRLYYVDTLKHELIGTTAYKLQASFTEKSTVDGHGCHAALNFGGKAKENQDKIPTLCVLSKLH